VDRCVPGREVVLRFRNRRTGKPWTASVVCPATWTRGRLLAYARGCHPNDTVRIEEWKSRGLPDDPWETRLWIVSPKEMVRG
jgi:hypothetical protein